MKVLYVKNGSERARQFQLQTTIYEENGQKFVKKSALCDEALPHLLTMKESYEKLSEIIINPKVKLAPIVDSDERSLTFEFIEGDSLEKRYHAVSDDKIKMDKFIQAYKELIFSSFKTTKFDTQKMLTDEFMKLFGENDYSRFNGKICFDGISNIDLIFSNLIFKEDDIYIIDYEWCFDVNIPVEFVIFRQLQQKDLTAYIPKEDFRFYQSMEDNFIHQKVIKNAFGQYSLNYSKRRLSIEQQLQEKEQQIQEKEQQLQAKEQQIQEKEILLTQIHNHNLQLQKELESVYNSKRWKLFYPIDKFRDLDIAKKFYLYIKSNRYMRNLYHKIPLNNEQRWRLRQFLTTGKISEKANVPLIEDEIKYQFSYLGSIESLPLVSVIIPCYNQGCYLWESVASAYASYSGEIEAIIVDDGSTDAKTIKCLREIKFYYPNVIVFHKENGGLSSARNFGLKQARGEYIQFLDADDILAPGKIDMQIDQIAGENNISICNYLTSNEKCTSFYKTEETIKDSELIFESFLFKWERGLSVPIHCGLFPTKILKEQKFDEELTAKEDWVLWVNLLKKGVKLKYIDIHAVVYRVHDESMVRRSFVKMSKQWESAYMKISNLLQEEQKEKFLSESKSWLKRYYISNPQYSKELKNNSNKKVKNKEFQKDIDLQKVAELIKKLDGFGSINPEISVIVPIFNHYEYLFECIGSVTKQGNVPLELICVDDYSSDYRVGMLLKELSKLPNIKVIFHHENQGISYVQNEAVQEANGEYIAFLDCDDYLKENALSIVFDFLKKRPNADYIFTDRTNIDSNGKILYDASYKIVKESENIKDDLLDRMIASHLKVIKKETYLKVGGSDEKMSGIQDWDLALKIAEIGELEYLPEPLYFHRLHDKSVTSSDSIGQYKKSNILRRKFANKWLKNGTQAQSVANINNLQDEESLNLLFTHEETIVFSPKNLKIDTWYCPKELKESFSEGKIIVFDARGLLDDVYIDFLKDFNSYFDLILCDRLSVSSQLIGTLWSEKIIWTPLVQKRF